MYVDFTRNNSSFPYTSFTYNNPDAPPKPLFVTRGVWHHSHAISQKYYPAENDFVREMIYNGGADELSVFATSLICFSESHQSRRIVRFGYSTRRVLREKNLHELNRDSTFSQIVQVQVPSLRAGILCFFFFSVYNYTRVTKDRRK